MILPTREFHDHFQYSEVKIEKKGLIPGPQQNSIPSTKAWLKRGTARSFRGTKFYPGDNDPKDPKGEYFNEWRGWATKPIKNYELLKTFADYTLNLVCSKDETKYTWIMQLLAHLIQKPEERPSFIFALRGDEEGTGKSTFFEIISWLIGEEYFPPPISDPEEIFGKFNEVLNKSIGILFEEVEWAHYKKYANRLRDLVSKPRIGINVKYENLGKPFSFTRFFVSGNAQHIMHIPRTGRRLTIFDINPEKRGDTAYFKEVRSTMKSGGLEALMYHLKYEVYISTFDPFKPLETDELTTQKDISIVGTEAGMVKEWLQDGTLPYDDVKSVSGAIKYLVPSKKMLWCFQQYRRDCGIRVICDNPTIFGINIRKCFPPMSDIHSTKCNVTAINKRQFNAYDCPSLAVCREFFAKEFKSDIVWNEEVKEWELLYIDTYKWYNGF